MRATSRALVAAAIVVNSLPFAAREAAPRLVIAAADGSGVDMYPQTADASPEVVSTRRVWASSDVDFGPRLALSPDGRFLAFNDTFHWGQLFVRDLIGGDSRVAVGYSAAEGGGPGGAALAGAAFSRDNQFLAFTWGAARGELRVTTLEDRVPAASRVLVAAGDIDWIRPYDWSPDGKSIAVQVWRKTGAEVAVVSLGTGALQVLKTFRRDELRDARLDAHTGKGIAFSPDGSRVAVEFFPVAESRQRDVLVLSTDGSREISGVVHPADDALIGWLPDGKRLLFTSDRTGRVELWTSVLRDDAFDAPALVPYGPDLGSIVPLRVTAAGAFAYFRMGDRLTDVWSGRLDWLNGQWIDRPAEIATEFAGRNSSPQWAPDGRTLAYISTRRNGRVIALQSLADGTTEEHAVPTPIAGYAWHPDGRTLSVTTSIDGKATILRVDPATRKTATVMAAEANVRVRSWETANRLYFERTLAGANAGERRTVIVERDPESGSEREVFSGSAGGANRLALSPEGRTVYYRRPVEVANPPHDLVARDLTTGNERVLVSQQALGPVTITRDGRHVLTTTTHSGATVLLVVPTAVGSTARRLQVDEKEPVGTLSWSAIAPDDASALVTRRFGEWMVENPPPSELWWVPFDGRPARRVQSTPEGIWLNQFDAAADGRVAFTRSVDTPAAVWLMEFASAQRGVR